MSCSAREDISLCWSYWNHRNTESICNWIAKLQSRASSTLWWSTGYTSCSFVHCYSFPIRIREFWDRIEQICIFCQPGHQNSESFSWILQQCFTLQFHSSYLLNGNLVIWTNKGDCVAESKSACPGGTEDMSAASVRRLDQWDFYRLQYSLNGTSSKGWCWKHHVQNETCLANENIWKSVRRFKEKSPHGLSHSSDTYICSKSVL